MIRLSTRDFLWHVALPSMIYSLLFFGGSEIIESIFLNRVDEATMHMLHFVRGTLSALFVSGIVLLSLNRALRGFHHQMESICSLLNAANEGLIAFDSGWKVISMNALARQLLGNVSCEEFREWSQQVRERLSSESQFEVEAPGEERRIRVVALQTEQGGSLLLLHDITEEKKLEDRLLITEKMASFGRMAAGLAHEIGTPLNIISGRAELIEGLEHAICASCSNKPECGLQKHIKIIFAQIERISSIIQQLLSQAREPLGRPEAFSLNESIKTVSEFLQPVMHKRSILLKVDLDKDLPKIFGFKDQFQQVLINLLTNSIDAMEGKSGSIRIETALRMSDLVLTIADEGCGISDVNLTKIFDPFFTTKEFGKGTGLGLTVTSNIIRSHGGTIDVHSRQNRGTQVAIHIPRQQFDPITPAEIWNQPRST